MDPIWISIAFILGFIVRNIGLPPLIGYLIAGFVLNYFGAESGDLLQSISDIGISLLLFTIGLKLKFKTLLKPEIWGGASVQMFATTLSIFAGVMILSYAGVSLFADLNVAASLTIAFAMSFSSTVFAMKVLEQEGETTSLHGTISIGVLIMQDLFAVLFLVFAAGKIPNIYALGIPLVLLVLKPLVSFMLKKAGHGEVLILFGFFLALVVGGELFNFVGLKSDLGALVAGMIIAGHPKSSELSDTLVGFKDVLLIGFFLNIGFSGEITTEVIITSLIVLTALLVKFPLYFLVFTRFRLRMRTAWLSSITLANFSEFGLIVASAGAAIGLLSAEWLVIIAIALSLSFVLAAPLNSNSYRLLFKLRKLLTRFQTIERLSYDKPYDIGDANVIISGMGRFGTAAYDQLVKQFDRNVIAIDYNAEVVEKHLQSGRNIIHDDATDMDFWEKVDADYLLKGQVYLIMLCMGDFHSNKNTINQLKNIGYTGMIAATAKYDDEVELLKRMGVNLAYNLYSEAGVGFANHVCEKLCSIKKEHEQQNCSN
jgi:glutathione-regulated potassium-efflux system ancillary protein KefC